MNQLSSKKEGLILIELLLAMAVFAIGTVMIFSLFINATQGVIIGLEKTRGLLLSNEALSAAYLISKEDQDYLTPGRYEVGFNQNDRWVLIPKTGLMSHFLLADNAEDSTIYEEKNDGIMEQITFSEDRKNQPLAAASFNGTDSHVKTEYAFSLRITGPLTLSAWVLDMDSEEEKTARTIARRKEAYLLYKEGNQYFFAVSGEGGTAQVSAETDYLSWEQVVGVYDPAGSTLRLYVNGWPKGEKTINITSLNLAPGKEFFIGAEEDNQTGVINVWQGRISDVRVYNRSLTSNEISGLYNSYSAPYEKTLAVSDAIFDLDEETEIWKLDDKALAGIWSFNEGEGCTAHDNSKNNHHGLIKNCSPTQWTENRYEKQGRAFNFEGNNYLEVADPPTLQIEDEISISLWLKMPEILPEKDMTILHKRAAGSEDFSFSLVYDYNYNEDENEKTYSYGWAAEADSPAELSGIKLTNAAIPDRWQHIIVTFDGQNMKIYIDNRQVEENDLELTTISNAGANSHLFIGQNAEGQDLLSETAIDGLRIYNKILTAAERQAVFLGETNYYLE